MPFGALLYAQTLPVNVYYTDDGLASSQVWSIEEDRNGAIWFGCASGISRFNGFVFKNFRLKEGLPSESVDKLVYSESGVLFVLTVKGVAYHFEGEDKFVKAPAKGEIEDISCNSPDKTEYPVLYAMIKGKGVFVFSLKTGKWSYFGLKEINPSAIYCSNKNLILGTKNGRIFVVSKKGEILKRVNSNIGEITKIKKAGKGKVLVISPHFVVLFTPENGEKSIVLKAPTKETIFFDAIQDSKGTFWVASNLGLYKLKNGKIRHYTDREGINGRVLSVFETSEGILWIGTNHGVVKLISEDMTVYKNLPNIKPGSFICFYWDSPSKTMFVGISSGVLKIKNNKVKVLNIDYLKKFPVWDIDKDQKGNFYFGTEGGGLVILTQKRKLRIYTKENGSLPGNYVTDILRINNTLYIACKNGFAVREKGKWKIYTTENGLPASYVRCLEKGENGSVLLGTLGEGIVVFKNGKFSHLIENCPEELKGIFDIYKEGKTIWAATNYGLAKIENNRYRLFSTESGFLKYGLSVIYPVCPKMFWIGSDGGAILFDKESEKVVKILTKDDGLPGNEFTTHNAIASDEYNNVWFGFFGAAVKIADLGLSDTRKVQFKPKILVKRVSYYLKNKRVKIVPRNTDLIIPYGAKEIYIDFEVIWYRNRYSLKIAYMLTGVNKSWTYLKELKNTSAYYTVLPPGQHNLKVRISSIFNSNMAMEKNMLNIYVPTPWWLKKEVHLLIVALFIVFITVSVKTFAEYKTKKLEKEKRMLNRIVEERTKQLKKTNKELEIANARLKELSEKDYLTGLFNRRYFMNNLSILRNIAERENSFPVCFVIFDIDNFKKINDTYGHIAGDQILQKVAGIINQNTRKGDIAARYGGEEFILMLVKVEKEKALQIAEKIRQKIAEERFRFNGEEIKITVSGGICCLNLAECSIKDIENCIDRADKKLYKAKKNGKNRIEG